MEFRKGTIGDLDEICNLICQAIANMEKQGIFQWDALYPTRDDFEKDIQAGNLYVCRERDSIAALYVMSDEYDEAYEACTWLGADDKAYILHRLCVSPLYQNRGLGKAVLTHAEEQIKSMGYESVRLDVFSQNPFALRLYESSGYVRRGQATWRKGTFYLMEKGL